MKNILNSTVFATALSFSAVLSAQAACLSPFECARLTGMVDINMGDFDFSSPMYTTQDFCVYTQNDDDSNHAILYFGTGFGGELIVSSGSFDITGSIDVQKKGDVSWSMMTPNIKTTLADPNTTDQTCAVGGDSVTMRIRFELAELTGQTAGTYTGLVTMQSTLD